MDDQNKTKDQSFEALTGLDQRVAELETMVERLRDSETRLFSAAEYSLNMVFINIGGRVVYANQACANLKRSILTPDKPRFSRLASV